MSQESGDVSYACVRFMQIADLVLTARCVWDER